MKLKKKTRRAIDWTASVLVLIGALNWGLVGVFNYNLVEAILGTMSVMSRIVYSVVGLSAVWVLIRNKKFMN